MRLGIRANPEASDWLDRAFGAYRIPEEPRVVNYSIRLSAESQDLHLLYRGGCLELRTRSAARLVNALGRHVRSVGRPDADHLLLRNPALLVDGRLLIVPPAMRDELVAKERSIWDHGALLVDSRTTAVDTSSGEVVVGPSLGLVPPPWAFEPRPPHSSEVAEGRYTVEAWISDSFAAHPAAWVREVMSCVSTDQQDIAAALRGAATFVRHLNRIPIGTPTIAALAAVLDMHR